MGGCGGKGAHRQSRDSRELGDGFHYSRIDPEQEDTVKESDDHPDIIQFAAPIFVAKEGAEFNVKLMRLGSLSGQVRCTFRRLFRKSWQPICSHRGSGDFPTGAVRAEHPC